MHPACLPIEALLIDCKFVTARRSGPGGQHRNKVATAVIIEHRPTGIVAEANEQRSKSDNRTVAIFRLRLRLATEYRSQWANLRETAAPLSPIWRRRSAIGKLLVAMEHDDFPAILAEALDHLAFLSWKVTEASERLGISSTQLVKLLKKHSPALVMLNQKRQELGLLPLK